MSKPGNKPGWPAGEQNKAAKLTAADVMAIRHDQRQVKIIAHQYGISAGHVSRIRLMRKWRHLAEQPSNP